MVSTVGDSESPLMAPDHLYTWVDIDNHFASLERAGRWPAWLLAVDAYWGSVRFLVTPGVDEDEIWEWLRAALGSLTLDQERRILLLEDDGEVERSIDVEIEIGDVPPSSTRRPHWDEHAVVRGLGELLPRPLHSSMMWRFALFIPSKEERGEPSIAWRPPRVSLAVDIVSCWLTLISRLPALPGCWSVRESALTSATKISWRWCTDP